MEPEIRPTRRSFIKGISATGIGLAGSAIATGAGGQVHVRKAIHTLDETSPDVVSYKKGIAAMRARQDSDKTSWTFQANIHGAPGSAPGPLWNACQHGSFFFPSWHRMYLYYFEQIVRDASGDPNFSLPYWNYSSPDFARRQLPEVMRQPADETTNPLYTPHRSELLLSGNAALPESWTDYSQAFSFTNFASPAGAGGNAGVAPSFGGQALNTPSHFDRPHGQIERQPHDVIHGGVGGGGGNPPRQEPGWMTDPNLAARDPIFWMHHANIDRLWEHWLAQGDGRANPTGNSAWMNTKFKFVKPDGTEAELTGEDVIDIVEQLDYKYDDQPAAPAQPESAPLPIKLTQKSLLKKPDKAQAPVELSGKGSKVEIALDKEAVAESASLDGDESQFTLELADITFDKLPGVVYEIYLNLPEDAKPDPKSIYFAGNLPFFALQSHGGGHMEKGKGKGMGKGGAHSIVITDTVKKLRERELWNSDEVSVRFVESGLELAEGQPESADLSVKAKIGKISISHFSPE